MIQRFLSRDHWNTVVYGGLGTFGFWYLDLPLPFLFGPMAASIIVALMGRKPAGFGQISIFARTILGVAVGASITPEVVASLPTIAKSVALVPIYLCIVGPLGYAYFRHVHKFDPPTAYFSAMPGGLQDMIIFGQEAGGNPRTLSLVHATRVLVIVSVAPILLTGPYGAVLSHPIGSPALDIPWHELVLMLVAAVVGWKVAARLGLFGASILGPLIAAAALSLGGLIHSRPPAEAILFCQFFVGTGIGVHYAGITIREMRQVVSAATLYVLLLATAAAVLAGLVTSFGFAEPLEAFLAFVPAGQAEIAILAIVAGADLGFVVTHHLVRITLVILGAPLILNRIRASRHRD